MYHPHTYIHHTQPHTYTPPHTKLRTRGAAQFSWHTRTRRQREGSREPGSNCTPPPHPPTSWQPNQSTRPVTSNPPVAQSLAAGWPSSVALTAGPAEQWFCVLAARPGWPSAASALSTLAWRQPGLGPLGTPHHLSPCPAGVRCLGHAAHPEGCREHLRSEDSQREQTASLSIRIRIESCDLLSVSGKRDNFCGNLTEITNKHNNYWSFNQFYTLGEGWWDGGVFSFKFPHHTEFLFYIIFFLLTAGLNYFLKKALIFSEAVETVSTPLPPIYALLRSWKSQVMTKQAGLKIYTIHKYCHSVNMWTKEVLSCFKFALYQWRAEN